MAKERILFAAIVAPACLLAYWLGGGARSPLKSIGNDNAIPQVIPGLSISPGALNLGEVWEEKDFRCKIPISNRAAHPIEIPGFAISCRCSMKVEPRQLTIPAGETAEVTVRLDLTHRLHTEIGLAQRPINVDLTPLAKNGQPLRHGWTLRGVIKSRLTLDCNHLEFGESAAVGEAPFVRKVRAIAHIPVKQLEIEADPEIVTVRTAAIPNAASSFELHISPSRQLSAGAFKASISVGVLTEAGEHLAGASLPVSGVMESEMRPIPARLALPATEYGKIAETMFLLQGATDGDIVVTGIATDTHDLTIEPTKVPSVQEGYAFAVRLKMSTVGDFRTFARFTVRRPGRDAAVYPMEIFCRGLQASMP